MARPIVGTILQSLLLLFLIALLSLGGIVWFDYLGVINVKPYLAPIYRLMGLAPQTGVPSPAGGPFISDLDDDRFAKRLEALTVRTSELDKREADLTQAVSQNEQFAKELEERQNSLAEREKTFKNIQEMYDNRNVNIESIVQNLSGMTPQNAVAILLASDDQNVIDILRKTEEMARTGNTSSMVAYWLSLMPPERAAQIQRKMLEKPTAMGMPGG
ncbi:MAG: flagellar protein FlbB [Spirochaetaceae bacterium]|jgi:flagellar protein FlbB|nr:flagellar protein FlbB [Spirochaetaceae bacterium]